MPDVSIVVPLFNEEENVTALYEELSEELAPLSATEGGVELIFVDDGSEDSTVERLRSCSSGDGRVKIICFRRNFGQTAALAAGLENASGRVVVTLDGDLQNDPSEIPAMVKKLGEGYDMVVGWRKDRRDSLLYRTLPSRIANYIISKVTRVPLHDYGCTLKVMRADVAKSIKLYGEMHRFIPALAAEMGAKILEVPVKHRPRLHGYSKYGLSKTFRVVLDLMTVKFFLGFSTRPIHLFGSLGLMSGVFGSFLCLYLVYEKLFLAMPIGHRPLLLCAVMLVLVGLQFFCFGLLAEILVRTYHESQSKSTYSIRRIVAHEEGS